MTIADMIHILAAFNEGKDIEARQTGGKSDVRDWVDIKNPLTAAGAGRFNFAQYEYRVAPRKPDVIYEIQTPMGYSIFGRKPLANDVILKTYIEKIDG